MESRRKRVEQKGRFTITEIIPGSPYSPRVSSPTFQDDEVSVADFPESEYAPISNESSSEVVVIQPQSTPLQQLIPAESYEVEKPTSNGVEEPTGRTEEPPETHTQPPETVSVPIEAKLLDMEASAMDCTSEVSTQTTRATAVPGSPPRKYSSLKKNGGARRVKRKGRFTIIELASDSPTSRKNSDDLYDHRLVTTTSIGGTSVESAPQLGNQLSLNFDNLERRSKPKRSTRSMPRLRQPSSMRRSRRRSESPSREFIESVDMVDPSGNQQQQQEATAYAKLQVLPATENTDPVAPVDLTTTVITASGGATMSTGISRPASVTSVVIPDNEVTTVTVSPTSVRPVTPSSQLLKLPETNGSIVNAAQTSITVSAAQFMQQQQTIASLIRQQHDLKQIISVLQEQQQQLMTIPSQITEVKRQRGGVSSNGDDEMRELYMQVDKLTRANETLHSLINAAEREARHRTLEIECLSEENDELRHRCGKLESRYMDERKQSFKLEEELQRLRMLSLTQQEQQLRQQQSQKLSNSQPSAAAV